MIIFLADGRLGNQIFQYAFLKTIAKKNERVFCLNMDMFFNTFDIDRNGICHVSNRYIRFICKTILLPWIIIPLSKVHVITYVEQKKDLNLRPLPEWNEKKGLFPFIIYVNSDFFQSESFFDPTLIANMHIKKQYLYGAQQIVSDIPDCFEKVFVHVRRGDYVNEPFDGERGIDLPISYFEDAIRKIKEDIKNPFFIFLSDDPSCVKGWFRGLEHKIFLKNSMEVDLAIMTLCNAGIISNSSYSWWGAYLMHTKKKVIAPKYWWGWKKRVESHVGIQPKFSEVIDVIELFPTDP
jgi:hypothetical protein